MEKALDALPMDLDATYVRSCERILHQKEYMKRLGLRTLRWVMYAERPLTTAELCEALATEELSDSGGDAELDDVDVIIGACAHLVEVTKTGIIRIIRPIHYSVQEFFTTSSSIDLRGHLLNRDHENDQINAALATTCIVYLQSKLADKKPCLYDWDLPIRLLTYPFLWYAARSFDVHIARCSSLNQDIIDDIAKLLHHSSSLLASMLQIKAVPPVLEYLHRADARREFDAFTGPVDICTVIYSTKLYDVAELGIYWRDMSIPPLALHRACSAGLLTGVSRLLADGSDMTVKDDNERTPVYIAAASGSTDIVKMLLNNGGDVNAQGGKYGNALQAASLGGHEKVVQILVDNGAEVNAEGGEYGHALQAASYGGDEKVVQMLLDNGAEVNAEGGQYGHALQAASYQGHEKVVQMLLDKGAEVNAQGGDYDNALQAASAGGHEKVVQMLLDKGAEVNAEGGRYGNALQAASAGGHEKVVQMLLVAGAVTGQDQASGEGSEIDDDLESGEISSGLKENNK